MWYSGNNATGRPIDAVTPSSGSTGAHISHLHPEHTFVVHAGHLQLCTLANTGKVGHVPDAFVREKQCMVPCSLPPGLCTCHVYVMWLPHGLGV